MRGAGEACKEGVVVVVVHGGGGDIPHIQGGLACMTWGIIEVGAWG